MAVRAGQAFIAIGPSFRGFKTKTETWVKSNLRAIEVEVKPKVSNKPIILPPVKGKDVKVGVDVDRSKFERSISAIESRLDRLSRGRFLINVGIALSPLAAPALASAVGGALGAGGIGVAGLAGIGAIAGVGAASLKRLATEQKAVTATTTARTAASKALTSAQRGVSSAEQGVVAAERALKASQDNVRDSLNALHEARVQAIKDLADLREKTADDALSTEAAQIGLIDAQNELARVQGDATSTALDLRKAKLGVAQAEDALADSRKQGAIDAKALAKAEKDGTSKAPGVVAAQKAVKAAEADRKQAREAVQQARADLGAAQSDAAAAQAVFAKAESAQAKALAALTPAQKLAAAGIERLKKNWAGFLDDVDPKLLGALVIGMDALGKVLPGLAIFMKPVAVAAGQMFAAFGNAAGTKGFKTFAGDLGTFTAGIAADATKGILNLARGFGNLLTAFMPLSTDMSGGLVVLTDRFAKWTAGLQDSSGFQSFTDYVRENGPLVLSTLGHLGLALIAIGKAAAPLGHQLLILITHVADFTAMFADAHPHITSTIVAVLALSSGVAALAVPAARVASLFGIFGRSASTTFGVLRSGVKVGKDFVGGMIDQRRALKDGASWATTFGSAVRQGASNTGRAAKTVAIYTLEQGRLGIAYLKTTALAVKDNAVKLASVVRTNAILLATRAWAAGQWLLNAALTANPIGLVIVGLVALGGLFVVLYEKVGWFRAGVDAAWAGMKAGFFWVQDHWKLLAVILGGPIGLAVVAIVSNFDKIRAGVSKVVGAFTSAKDGIAAVWGKIADAVTNPLTTIKKALNVFFSGIDTIAKFFGTSFKFRFDVSTPKKETGKPPPKRTSGRTEYAAGGVLPGWSPGRDIHTFTSPTGGKLRLSGGESVMVPEWTAAMGGEKAVQRMNVAARRGQAFANGGVVWPTKSKHWTTYAGHDGIDLNGPGNGLGDPYFAAKAGIVGYTGTGRGYGKKVELGTYGGPTLVYGHSSKINVKAGQRVRAGQMLGRIGYSGHVIPAGPGGSHLHFGLVGEGPDRGNAARAFLAGAKMPTGGGGGGGGNPLSEIKSLIMQTKKLANNLDAGPFGSMLKKSPDRIGGMALSWAKKKLNPVDDVVDVLGNILGSGGGGTFDRGGLATSAGLMLKNTMRPERVLPPSTTAALEAALPNLGRGGDKATRLHPDDISRLIDGILTGSQRVADGTVRSVQRAAAGTRNSKGILS